MGTRLIVLMTEHAHEALEEFFRQPDKLAHILLAACLVCLVGWGVDRFRTGVGISLGCLATFGGLYLLEVWQGQVDGADIVANTIGCGVVTFFWFLRYRVERRRDR